MGDDIVTRAITPNDWPLIEALFGPNGACGGCWCMAWRVLSLGRYWEEHKGADNRAAFRALVRSGRAFGCLALENAAPIGWCGFGPRHDFDYLNRARKLPKTAPEGTWCVTCFYMPRRHQGRGLSGKLLACAVESARDAGARYLDGFPVVPKGPAKPVPPAFAHTGLPSIFAASGFEKIAPAGGRDVYRLKLG